MPKFTHAVISFMTGQPSKIAEIDQLDDVMLCAPTARLVRVLDVDTGESAAVECFSFFDFGCRHGFIQSPALARLQNSPAHLVWKHPQYDTIVGQRVA